jgi:hypothetical protein
MSDGIDNPIGSIHFMLLKDIHLLLMIAVKSNLNLLNKKRYSFYSIGLNYKLVGSLFVCWMLAFLSLSKGIQSLGKVSYVTAIFRKFTDRKKKLLF